MGITAQGQAKPGMSNMRPFASTPAARTKDTVIWSFNGQNCSFYHLNWINVCRSQKTGMLFFIQNDFYTWEYDRLFPSVINILNKEDILYVRHVKHAARGPHVVCGPHDNTNVTHMALGRPSVWHACSMPSKLVWVSELQVQLWLMTSQAAVSAWEGLS
jgi:hypothetical protein